MLQSRDLCTALTEMLLTQVLGGCHMLSGLVMALLQACHQSWTAPGDAHSHHSHSPKPAQASESSVNCCLALTEPEVDVCNIEVTQKEISQGMRAQILFARKSSCLLTHPVLMLFKNGNSPTVACSMPWLSVLKRQSRHHFP